MTGPELRAALKTVGWSTYHFARITKRHPQTINGWLRGKWRPPWIIEHWLEDLVRYHEAHPVPPLLNRNGRERVARQPDIPQLAQEQQRDADRITADAGDHAAVPSDDTVADRHSVPHGWYRPPGS